LFLICFALPGKILFLAWPRKSIQKEGHPISAFTLRFAALPFRSPDGLMVKALRCSDALKRDLKTPGSIVACNTSL
jgi:hypothetical protein